MTGPDYSAVRSVKVAWRQIGVRVPHPSRLTLIAALHPHRALIIRRQKLARRGEYLVRQTSRATHGQSRGRPNWSSGGQTHHYPSPNAARTEYRFGLDGRSEAGDRRAWRRIVLGHVLAEQVVVVEEVVRVSGRRGSGSFGSDRTAGYAIGEERTSPWLEAIAGALP